MLPFWDEEDTFLEKQLQKDFILKEKKKLKFKLKLKSIF